MNNYCRPSPKPLNPQPPKPLNSKSLNINLLACCDSKTRSPEAETKARSSKAARPLPQRVQVSLWYILIGYFGGLSIYHNDTWTLWVPLPGCPLASRPRPGAGQDLPVLGLLGRNEEVRRSTGKLSHQTRMIMRRVEIASREKQQEVEAAAATTACQEVSGWMGRILSHAYSHAGMRFSGL